MPIVDLIVYAHLSHGTEDREETFNGPVSFEDTPDSLFKALFDIEAYDTWDTITLDNSDITYRRYMIRRTKNPMESCKKLLQQFQDALVCRPTTGKMTVYIEDDEITASELEKALGLPQHRLQSESLTALLAKLNAILVLTQGSRRRRPCGPRAPSSAGLASA